MKTINIYPQVKRLGRGHYVVTVFENHEEIGTFKTTNSQLIDDIDEMNQDGFESHLVMHETFEEVIKTVLSNINN